MQHWSISLPIVTSTIPIAFCTEHLRGPRGSHEPSYENVLQHCRCRLTFHMQAFPQIVQDRHRYRPNRSCRRGHATDLMLCAFCRRESAAARLQRTAQRRRGTKNILLHSQQSGETCSHDASRGKPANTMSFLRHIQHIPMHAEHAYIR